MMKRRRPGFGRVYAGPPQDYRDENGEKDDPSLYEAVYAGPEPEEEPVEDPAVTAEPEPGPEPEPEPAKPEPPVNMPVYAGPPPQPADLRQFEGAYAGPAPDPRMFMMVYAGPQQMSSGPIGFMGIGMPAPAENKITPNPNRKTCEKCGASMPNEYNFCGYCGTPFPARKVCPMCKAEVTEGQKFCKECGTVLK